MASRGFYAYVRYLSLEEHPQLADRLPVGGALSLAGQRLQAANLWLGDGAMRSSLHYDGFDNLLVQLLGRKTVLIFSPEALRELGYRRVLPSLPLPP